MRDLQCTQLPAHGAVLVLPLTTMSEHNGATELLPQSHLACDKRRQEFARTGKLAASDVLRASVERGTAVSQHNRFKSCSIPTLLRRMVPQVLMDLRLLHRGGRNRSPHNRPVRKHRKPHHPLTDTNVVDRKTPRPPPPRALNDGRSCTFPLSGSGTATE